MKVVVAFFAHGVLQYRRYLALALLVTEGRGVYVCWKHSDRLHRNLLFRWTLATSPWARACPDTASIHGEWDLNSF